MDAKTIANEICKSYRMDLFEEDRQSVREIIKLLQRGINKIDEEQRRDILREATRILEDRIEVAEERDYYYEHCPDGLQ